MTKTKDCLICKKDFEYNSPVSKYCKPCRLENDRRREKEWRQTHPQETKKHSKKYRLNHLEEKRVASRKWNQENKELKRIYCQNRRAMKAKNGGKLTIQEWELIKTEQDYKCWDCGSKTELTMGHAIPISKGGRTDYFNILAQCMPCNHKQAQNVNPTFKTYGNHPLSLKCAYLFSEDNDSEEYWDDIFALVNNQYAKGIW